MNSIVNRVKKFMKQTGHVCITWSLLFLFIVLIKADVQADTYVYDDLNRVVKVIYDDQSYMIYEYDANGNMTKQTYYGKEKPEVPEVEEPKEPEVEEPKSPEIEEPKVPEPEEPEIEEPKVPEPEEPEIEEPTDLEEPEPEEPKESEEDDNQESEPEEDEPQKPTDDTPKPEEDETQEPSDDTPKGEDDVQKPSDDTPGTGSTGDDSIQFQIQLLYDLPNIVKKRFGCRKVNRHCIIVFFLVWLAREEKLLLPLRFHLNW